MANKAAIFIGVLCLCIFLNLLLNKFPVTITIGSHEGNSTGLQFQLVGVGVPIVQSKSENVLPVMPRAALATFDLTSNGSRGLQQVNTATMSSRQNNTHFMHKGTQEYPNEIYYGEGLDESNISKSSLSWEPGNFSLLSNTENAKVISIWRKEMYCKLKTIPFSTLARTSKMEGNTNDNVLPIESLEKLVHFNYCAVVSSSHGLRLHRYGEEIDAHDAVLRFNCAPTDKFEEFVGSRTDIRLINTQIPEKTCTNEFWNDSVPMFNNETVVIRNWEAIRVGPHGVNDISDKFHVIKNLKKFRRTFPNRTMPFIQRPDFGPDIKAELRRFCLSTRKCNKNKKTPSTGILGVVMMLHLCNWVHVYEIVPSNKDNTNLRYYYDEKANKSGKGVAGSHSYSQEQQYIRTLSLAPDQDMDDTGVALLKGLDMVQCD